MADETFELFVQRERARLHGEREAIFTQQHDLEDKLAAVNRELAAIDAYEAAKSGKAPVATRRTVTTRGSRRARRGSRREQLITLIRAHHGLTRGEILEQMSLKGDKAGEMSVSNALTALTKANQIRRNEARKYVAA